jgi:hypothetical protein
MCLGWFFDFDEKSGVVPGLLLLVQPRIEDLTGFQCGWLNNLSLLT